MEGKAKIVFPIVITAIIVFVVSGVVTFFNIGLRSDFVPRWLSAFIVGWLAERGWSRDVLRSIMAMIAGEVAIYVFGLAWLSRYVGWGQVLALGLFPFLIGDTVKLIAAALIVPAGWRIRER